MDYYWVTAGWSDCYLENVIEVWNNSECGTGTHYREVKCFDKRIEEEVPESRCDPYLKPPPVGPCRIFCPGECVVSEWNISKRCTEPCTSDSFQELTRKVLREPNSTAERCPPLIEREPCVLNATCHHHNWVLGPWGSCVVPEGAYCGEGVQKRPLICLRSDGRQVDPIQCEKTHKSLSLQQPLSKPCYIDCPVDCVMSLWSPWDKTSCKACGPIGGCSSEPQPCFPTCHELGGFCDNGTCYCENDHDERITLGPTSKKCFKKGPRPPANHSAPTPEINLKYYPDDSKVSFWMYAMISIGTAFIIFVAVTVYLMCRSSLRQRTVSVERQPSVRRRLTDAINDQSKPTLESSPDVRSKFNKCNETYFTA